MIWRGTETLCTYTDYHGIFALLTLLRSIDWYLFTDVSGCPVSHPQGQTVQSFLNCLTYRLFLKVGRYESTLRKIPEERISHLPRIGSLQYVPGHAISQYSPRIFICCFHTVLMTFFL